MTINHDSDCTTITQSDLAMFKCIAEPKIECTMSTMILKSI